MGDKRVRTNHYRLALDLVKKLGNAEADYVKSIESKLKAYGDGVAESMTSYNEAWMGHRINARTDELYKAFISVNLPSDLTYEAKRAELFGKAEEIKEKFLNYLDRRDNSEKTSTEERALFKAFVDDGDADDARKTNNQYTGEDLMLWLFGSNLWNVAKSESKSQWVEDAYNRAVIFIEERDSAQLQKLDQASDTDYDWARFLVGMLDYKWGKSRAGSYFYDFKDIVETGGQFESQYGHFKNLVNKADYDLLWSLRTWFNDIDTVTAPANSNNLDQLRPWWNANKWEIADRLRTLTRKDYRNDDFANPWDSFRRMANMPMLAGDPDLLMTYMRLEAMESIMSSRASRYNNLSLSQLTGSASMFLSVDPSEWPDDAWRAKREKAFEVLNYLDPREAARLQLKEASEDVTTKIGIAKLFDMHSQLAAMTDQQFDAFMGEVEGLMIKFVQLGDPTLTYAEVLNDFTNVGILDSSLRSTVALLRGFSGWNEIHKVNLDKPEKAFGTIFGASVPQSKFVITCLLFASMALNARNLHHGETTDALGISRLLGEAIYTVALPFAFNDMAFALLDENGGKAATLRRWLAGLLKFDYIQIPKVKAALDNVLSGDVVTGAVRDRALALKTLVDNNDMSGFKTKLYEQLNAIPDDLLPTRELRELRALQNSQLAHLFKEVNSARLAAAGKTGGGLLGVGDIAIGIGQIIEGAKYHHTAQGKYGIATGSTSLVAGVTALGSALAWTKVLSFAPGLLAASAIFTALGAVMGLIGLFAFNKKPYYHPIWGDTADDNFDF